MSNNPRSALRGMTTQSQKRRLLKVIEDDTLVSFLVDAAQDSNDPKITRYENEEDDIIEIIKEILRRMDAARALEELMRNPEILAIIEKGNSSSA